MKGLTSTSSTPVEDFSLAYAREICWERSWERLGYDNIKHSIINAQCLQNSPSVRQSIGSTVHWSDSPLVRQSTCTTVHWSDRFTEKQQDEWRQPQTFKSHTIHWTDSPLVRQSIGPTVHWSDSPLVQHIYWIVIIDLKYVLRKPEQISLSRIFLTKFWYIWDAIQPSAPVQFQFTPSVLKPGQLVCTGTVH